MSEIIGVGQLSLMDLNDAIIAGTPPKNPTNGTLWIDESVDPPMLKKWNGNIWVDIGELDPDLSITLDFIDKTLGNMANDNIIDFKERQVVKDRLTEIIGYVIPDTATVLPTTTTLDNSGKGGFWSVRQSALNAGILSDDAVFVNVATRYNNLKSYLDPLTPVDIWDLRPANKDKVINVTKSTFRDRWLQYYLAVEALATATAQKLKQNVDDIEVGGRNLVLNGGFEKGLESWTKSGNEISLVKDGGYRGNGMKLIMTAVSTVTPRQKFTAQFGAGTTLTGTVKVKTVSGSWDNMVMRFANSLSIPKISSKKIDDEWTLYTYQVKLDSTLTLENTDFGFYSSAGEFIIDEVQLEIGTKASDFSPAPEDTQNQIDNIVGRIDDVEFRIEDDRIITKVTSSEKYLIDLQAIENKVAKLLTLEATSNIMSFNANNAFSPASQTITFKANLQNLTGTPTFTATPYNSAGTAMTAITLGGSGTTRTLTHTQFGTTAVRVVVTASLGGLSDTITIVKVKDGATGSAGSAGSAGKDAIVGFLTNESITLSADVNGNVSSFSTATGTFEVYEGTTKRTGSPTYSVVSSTSCTVSITTAGVYSVTAMTADTAKATLRAVYGGVTINKDLSLSKSRRGATGATGSKGDRGSDGKGVVSAIVNYQLHTSGTTAPTGAWLTSPPSPIKGRYLWTRTITTYTDNDNVITYSVSYLPTDGQKGVDGKGISSTTVHYQISTSGTTTPTGTWLTTVPAPIKGRYLWTRTTISYTDGTNSISYSTAYYATDGQKGDMGTGVSSIEEEYYLSTSKTTQSGGSWVSKPPVWSTGKYMWTRSKITYSNPTSTDYTTPVVDTAWEAVNEIEIGGRNLLKNSNPNITSNVYMIKSFPLAEKPVVGEDYTIRIKGNLGSGKTSFTAYNSGGQISLISLKDVGGGFYEGSFQWKNQSGSNTANDTSVNIYTMPNSVSIESTIEWIKLEKGNKPSDWTPAPEDIDAEIAKAKSDANNAQNTANTAVNNAKTANDALADIASDSKLTSSEKKITKKEWDIIVSERANIVAQGTKYSISTTAYTNAYNALSTYITPLLSNLNTTSNIVGTTFRANFKSYYDARTALLKAVSDKAKDLADSAQSKANSAQENLDNLEIGGRNLVRNGKAEYSYNLTLSNLDIVPEMISNTEYTISFDAKTSNGTDTFYMSTTTTSPGSTFQRIFSMSPTKDYKRYSYTFKSSNGSENVKTLMVNNRTVNNPDNTGILYLKNIKLEKGNKATDFTEAPEDTEKRIDDISGLLKVRYIRDWINGSSANTNNHWVEVKAMSGTTNRARGITPTSNGTLSNSSRVTDDLIGTTATDYASGQSGLNQYIQIDLGRTYLDIDYIQVWHYYTDGRTYNNTKTEISVDGENWVTLFDSAVDGTYTETAEGKEHNVNRDVSTNLRDVSTNITIVASQLNSVEEIITSEGITTVISESVFYENLMKDLENKADTDTIGDLATKGELEEAISDVDGAIHDAIESIDFEPYTTKAELEETARAITSKFSASGGINLIKNSIGYAEGEFWNTFNGLDTIQNNDLDNLGFGSGFRFMNGRSGDMRQIIPVVGGVTYTLSWWALKTNESATNGSLHLQFKTSDNATILTQHTYGSSEITDGYVNGHVSYTPDESGDIMIRIYGYPEVDGIVTGLMLNIGDVPLQWSLATGEVYNTNIRMDINGIRVSQLDEDRLEIGYTQITPEEFAGYHDTDGNGTFEKVFYLNGEETVTKKMRAEEEITMGDVKIIKINSSSNSGWAFVPIVDSRDYIGEDDEGTDTETDTDDGDSNSGSD